MSLLAIIPARGGSKRFPGKNIFPLLGKPLIMHTVDALIPCAAAIIITSDSNSILNTVWKHTPKDVTNVTYHKRDPKLASDTSTVLETVIHLANTANKHKYIGLFLPTAPLRTSNDVSEALNILSSKNADGIISTTDYEFPPTLGLVTDPDGFVHCADKSLPFIVGNTRSQDHNSVIRPNGAIYIKKFNAFLRDNNFFKGRILNYHMPRDRSADIDTKLDLRIVELLHGQVNGSLE